MEIIKNLISFLSLEISVMLTAAIPIVELRGAIPIGIALGLSPIHSAILSFVGSMIPVPFILFAIRPVFNYLRSTKAFNKMVSRLTDRSKLNSQKIEKYGVLGLILIVAIPLPGTGVWSGSLAAGLMNIRFKWAFPAILLGNFIAGILVVTLTYLIM